MVNVENRLIVIPVYRLEDSILLRSLFSQNWSIDSVKSKCKQALFFFFFFLVETDQLILKFTWE